MIRKLIVLFGLVFLLGVVAFVNRSKITPYFFTPRNVETVVENVPFEEQGSEDIVVVAGNLDIPWELVFLPGGDMLVTERAGKLLKISVDTKVVAEISGVRHIGEGGLLGMALDPDFSKNRYIYLYSTTDVNGLIENRVERYVFDGSILSGRQIVVEGISGSSNHDGGRIAFGPDGYLYITTGDAENPNSAQDKDSFDGKILRYKDGKTEVYSYGHRNPQGIAWDSNGNLWSTEHGPSGSQTGNDEVNLIVQGGNYGWPVIRGSQVMEGMMAPVIESGRSDTWAPSGLAYLNGNLFFAGLRGEALYQVGVSGNKLLDLTAHFKGQFGRLRTVVVGPDGDLYLLTSNKDGRGRPKDGDDKIIRVSAEKLLSQ